MKKLGLIAALFLLSSGMLVAQNPVADQNASKPQSHSNQGQAVPGKTQANHAPEPLVTTTDSVDHNTPGIETEAGQEQKPGGNGDIPHTASATPTAKKKANPTAPHDPAAPGQTQQEADRNAAAAGRAEIEPTATLGVNGTTNSTSNTGVAAQTQANDLPQTDQTAHGKKHTPNAKNAGAKKTGANKAAQKKSSTKKQTGSDQQ